MRDRAQALCLRPTGLRACSATTTPLAALNYTGNVVFSKSGDYMLLLAEGGLSTAQAGPADASITVLSTLRVPEFARAPSAVFLQEYLFVALQGVQLFYFTVDRTTLQVTAAPGRPVPLLSTEYSYLTQEPTNANLVLLSSLQSSLGLYAFARGTYSSLLQRGEVLSGPYFPF